jgi:hypothetical protein
MMLPGFTAEATLGTGAGRYRHAAAAATDAVVVPALYRKPVMGYSCSGSICKCYGDDDCNDMFSSDVCKGAALCHSNGTTWCECSTR